MSIEMKKTFSKYLGGFLLLLVSTLILSVSSFSSVSAGSYDDASDRQQKLKMYLYAELVKTCYEANIHVETDNERVDNGQLFYSQAGNAQPIVYAVNPTILGEVSGFGDDYWTGCGHDDGALTKAALRSWGISAIDLVCKMGYVRDGNGASCKETTTLDYKSWGGINDKNTRVNSFVSALKSLTGLDVNNPGNDILYMKWKSVVVESCTTGSGLSVSEATVSGDLRYELKEAGETGSEITRVYSGGNKKSESPHTLPISYTCGQALTNANNNVGAYISATKEVAARKLCQQQGYTNISGGSFPGTYTLNACVQGALNKDNRYLCTTNYPDYTYQGVSISRQTERDACLWGQGQTLDVSAVLSEEATAANGTTDGRSSCVIEAIGWILCPAVNFLSSIADSSFDFLSDAFLATDPQAFNTTSSTYGAWQQIRNVANVIFVIGFIIIIFSQLTGMGVSNYGVKKTLPRLIIAAILVNISFFITQIAVDLSNILGYSIRDVFDAIARSASIDTAQNTTSSFATGGGFAGVAGLILTGVVGAAALYALLSTFLPILLAAVIALAMILFILIARQAIIILLVVLAPLAFVALLLPNTERLFKLWRKMLTAMLLLFPIIALVFGASLLASKVLSNSFSGHVDGDGSNVFGQIIAAAVLIIPLFVIPTILKKSLDAVPMLGQMAGKLQSRANKNLGNKLGDSYKNSAWGRGRTARKAARQAYRDRKFAKTITEGGLQAKIAGAAAGGVGGLMKTKQGQYTQQALERAAIATNNKARSEDVDTAAALMLERHGNATTQIDDVAKELEAAAASGDGDVIKARAAQSILLRSGGKGLDTLHDTLAKIENTNPGLRDSDVGISLRSALNEAGLKGKDNALAEWSYVRTMRNENGQIVRARMDDNGQLVAETDENGRQIMAGLTTQKQRSEGVAGIESTAGIYGSLSSTELGGQRMRVLQAARDSGVITAAQAHAVLKNEAVMKDMDIDKENLFRGIAGLPPADGSRPQPSATAVATPTPQQQSPVSTPGGVQSVVTPQQQQAGQAATTNTPQPDQYDIVNAARTQETAGQPPAQIDPSWADWHRQQGTEQTVLQVGHGGEATVAVAPAPQNARASQEEARRATVDAARQQRESAAQRGSTQDTHGVNRVAGQGGDDWLDRINK